MMITKTKYAIVTKNFPLEFDDGNGNTMDHIEEAYLYSYKEDADKNLQDFDDPDEYQVIKVDVTYEF